MLPWETWEQCVESALTVISTETQTVEQSQHNAWVAVFHQWSAAVVAADARGPMERLRSDSPPSYAAAAWWTVLFGVNAGLWRGEIVTLMRMCRLRYMDAIAHGSAEDAVREVERQWDRMSDHMLGAFPATAVETLYRMERTLAELSVLRTHAIRLLRASVQQPIEDCSTTAAQIYAVGELEFEKELKWVAQLRTALEGQGALPEGVLYSYVTPAPVVEPPDAGPDPFDFVPSTSASEKAPVHSSLSSGYDPFAF